MAKPTSRARKNLGDSGERLAALLIEQRGYHILARNFRTRSGELDLVAQDANDLVFIEVRVRKGAQYGTPEESLTPRKREHLLTAANVYLEHFPQYADCAWRIDLVAIELDARGRVVRTDLIKNAVEA